VVDRAETHALRKRLGTWPGRICSPCREPCAGTRE
jgi:hypothetical protein